jgi:hypothetical protein
VLALRAFTQTPAVSRAVAAPLSDALSGRGTAGSTDMSSALTFFTVVVMQPVATCRLLRKERLQYLAWRIECPILHLHDAKWCI